MKLLASVSGAFLFIVYMFSVQVNLSSCQKTVTHDTIRIRDTIVIRDSVNCNCYDLTKGLVAYYDFKGGSLNDLSGKNNHILFNNAVKTSDRFSKADNAFLFNGTTSYMRVANSASLNPANGITMMAVVNAKSFNLVGCGGNLIFGKGSPDNIDGQYVLRIKAESECIGPVDPSKELFQGAYGNFSTKAEATDVSYVSPNKWYTIIYTYENGESKLYVNGVLTKTKKGPQTIFTANSQDLYIGKHNDPSNPYPFNGVIDGIRIYDRAVCQGEVNQLNSLQD